MAITERDEGRIESVGDGHFRGNKRLIQKINCSVVLDLGWGNTREDLYTKLQLCGSHKNYL